MLERIRRALAPPPAPLEQGGIAFEALYPPHRPTGLLIPSYPASRSVAASTSSAIIAPANPARGGLTIVNDGTANLYVNFGQVAATSLFKVKLGPGQTFVIEEPDVYQGDVAGVWDVANGSARISETT